MTFDLEKILESKRAYRQKLAAKPIAEKLRVLEQLSERALALRSVRRQNQPPPSQQSIGRARKS